MEKRVDDIMAELYLPKFLYKRTSFHCAPQTLRCGQHGGQTLHQQKDEGS